MTLKYTDNINFLDLEGRWFILMSNFPMWLKGDKRNRSLNYYLEKRGAITGLSDEVE